MSQRLLQIGPSRGSRLRTVPVPVDPRLGSNRL